MFRVHTPIISRIRCWVAAYGFLHRVFGWVVVLRSSSSQDHHPSKNSVQKTICCNSTSNAPDEWAYVPETCRGKNTSIKLPSCIKLVFHFISLQMLVTEVTKSITTRKLPNTVISSCNNLYRVTRKTPAHITVLYTTTTTETLPFHFLHLILKPQRTTAHVAQNKVAKQWQLSHCTNITGITSFAVYERRLKFTDSSQLTFLHCHVKRKTLPSFQPQIQCLMKNEMKKKKIIKRC